MERMRQRSLATGGNGKRVSGKCSLPPRPPLLSCTHPPWQAFVSLLLADGRVRSSDSLDSLTLAAPDSLECLPGSAPVSRDSDLAGLGRALESACSRPHSPPPRPP